MSKFDNPTVDLPGTPVVSPVITDSSTQLTGHLRTADLVFAALALAGPLAATTGYTTLLIAFGSGLGTPWTFLGVMAVLLLFALAYGAMTRNVDRPGAFYSYITAGLGRHIGLGSSFVILASYVTIGISLLAFAGLSMAEYVGRMGGPEIPWYVFSSLYWLLVGVLAYFRVDISARVLGLLLILEVLVVLVFDIVSLVGGAQGLSLEPLNPVGFFDGNVGFAVVFGVALFTGFEATAIYREETVNPRKTIPRAAVIVVLVIGLFYAFTAFSFITGLGSDQAVARATEDPTGVFFLLSAQYGGKILADVASVLLITSIFAAMLAIQNVATRYVYSLAVDGVLPRKIGIPHRRFGSPARASVTMSTVYLVGSLILILAGLTAVEIYSWFAGVASFTLIIAMALVSLSAVVFYYFGAGKTEQASFSNRIAPVLALIGLTVFAVLAQLNFSDIAGSSGALTTVMIMAAYLTFTVGVVVAEVIRRRSPSMYMKIGRQ